MRHIHALTVFIICHRIVLPSGNHILDFKQAYQARALDATRCCTRTDKRTSWRSTSWIGKGIRAPIGCQAQHHFIPRNALEIIGNVRLNLIHIGMRSNDLGAVPCTV